MKTLRAVFKKQIKDTLKNPSTLIQFIIYPLMAFGLMTFIDFDSMIDMEGMIIIEGMTEAMIAQAYAQAAEAAAMAAESMPNMLTMQATIFAGMGLIPAVAGIIAEDREKRRLRFLMMAGVRPWAYLLGVGGVLLIAGFFTSFAFSLIGEFGGRDFWIFLGSMMSGVSASIVLGAAIGILAKNQQAATGLAVPAALVLGMGPIMAQFSDDVAHVFRFFYTQQLNVVADHLTLGSVNTDLWNSFGIMLANVAVLAILFALVYRKRGLAV